MYSIDYVSCQTRGLPSQACPAKPTRMLDVYPLILVAILAPRPAELVSSLASFPIRHKYAVLI